MSFLEIPAFDALKGHAAPFEGFGEPIVGASLGRDFDTLAAEALVRITEGFWPSQPSLEDAPVMLDAIISEMWRTDWDPKIGNLNLFVRDFGAILTRAVMHMWGGELVFRSAQDVSHLSVWWPAAQFEAFPFHKVVKALHRSRGESLAVFAREIGQSLNCAAN